MFWLLHLTWFCIRVSRNYCKSFSLAAYLLHHNTYDWWVCQRQIHNRRNAIDTLHCNRPDIVSNWKRTICNPLCMACVYASVLVFSSGGNGMDQSVHVVWVPPLFLAYTHGHNAFPCGVYRYHIVQSTIKWRCYCCCCCWFAFMKRICVDSGWRFCGVWLMMIDRGIEVFVLCLICNERKEHKANVISNDLIIS